MINIYKEKLHEKIISYINNQDYISAIEHLKNELQKSPKDLSLITQLGVINYELKNYDKSVEYFRQGLFLKPANNNLNALYVIANINYGFENNNIEDKIQYFINDQDNLSRYATAIYFYYKNEYNQSFTISKKLFERDEDNIEFLILYIKNLIALNMDSDLILTLFVKFESLKNPTLSIMKLKYLYRIEEFEKCKKLCKKILLRYPNSEQAFVALELSQKIKQIENMDNIDEQKNHADNNEPVLSLDKNLNHKNFNEPIEHNIEAFKELNSLIGLDSVKDEIDKIGKKIEFDKLRAEKLGIEIEDDQSYHFVFSGNPGTGKTTVARLLGDIFYNFGLLEKGHLIEVDRGDLVGEYQGHTAVKTKKIIDKALGGVLFIDEAYSLYRGDGDSFGLEAIDALVKGVEDHRNDFIVILAGYREDMERLIKSNAGLESRFTKYIDFPDYTEKELLEIAKLIAKENHYSFSNDGELAFYERIGKEKVNKRFGNARAVRTLVNEAFEEKANNYANDKADLDYLTILTASDFGIKFDDNAKSRSEQSLKELNTMIGLKNVKHEITSMISLANYQKKENYLSGSVETGLTKNMHMCFLGNPGTGKTTVARLYGKILKDIGLLKKGQLVEVSRSDLVGRYQGHTAIKVKDVCEDAYGGILFIDEAYSLVNSDHDSFGLEAVSTLIKEMEDNRDKMIVIFAGYTKEMEEFMDANSGIKSRIASQIEFPDYNVSELTQIFDLLVDANNIFIENNAKDEAYKTIETLFSNRDNKFGNAREIRSLYEKIWQNMVNRVEKYNLEGIDRRTFTLDDVINI